MKPGAQETWISVVVAAQICGLTPQAIRKTCASKPGFARKNREGGGSEWEVLLAALPEAAQGLYWQRALAARTSPEAQHEAAVRSNQEILDRARRASAAGRPVGKLKLNPVPIIDQAEREALWARYELAPAGTKAKAQRRLEIVLAYDELERTGVAKKEIERSLRERYAKEASPPTLWRLREAVRGQDRGLWLPLLLPRWTGRSAKAEFSEAGWRWILSEWGITSRPALKPIWIRAREMAAAEGWTIPSLDAVQRRIELLPHWMKVYLREGREALASLYPCQERAYDQPVHALWGCDGRKHDLMVVWEDGSVSRPILVVWLENRTRYPLSWRFTKSETAEVFALTFKAAAERTGALPEKVLLDNGRGFASKMLTGGIPNRYRFKARDDDPLGVFPALGIEVGWAMPDHGQSKPIESFWRTFAEMDKRSDFTGCYVGNKPDMKPADFDLKKAIPIDKLRSIVDETMQRYVETPHRGDGMDGLSPRAAYEKLLPEATPRPVTAAQLRLCLLAVEGVKIGKDGRVRIRGFGGNGYSAEELAALPRDRTYTARYNPFDAREPIYLYDGTRLLCECRLVDRVGFGDREKAKEHQRSRNDFVKSKKETARAATGMQRAKSWHAPRAAAAAEDPRSPLPAAKVVQLHRPVVEAPAAPTPTQAGADDDLIPEAEIWRVLNSKSTARRTGD
jgi:hypothetical protein